mgnify:CR=1 FL=1
MSHDGFSPSWLRLREPYDHAARSTALADRLAATLPSRPHVVELACGLGSGHRFLAPRLPDASWCLVDHDPLLLDHAPAGVETRLLDLRTALPDGPWDAVVTQALLDLVSLDWLVMLADWLSAHRLPFLAALTVDGRVHWSPENPLDAEVQAAFRAHQRLDRGFGPSPGPTAAHRMAELLEARGYTVAVEQADWQVEASASHMLTFMVDGTAEAARVTHTRPARVDTWHAQRSADVAAGRVRLTVGHLDLVALPG